MRLRRRDIIRSGARFTKRKGLNCEQRDEILMLAQAGNSLVDIAVRFGIGSRTVEGICEENGADFSRPVLGLMHQDG